VGEKQNPATLGSGSVGWMDALDTKAEDRWFKSYDFVNGSPDSISKQPTGLPVSVIQV
jgi:hypothetical protein